MDSERESNDHLQAVHYATLAEGDHNNHRHHQLPAPPHYVVRDPAGHYVDMPHYPEMQGDGTTTTMAAALAAAGGIANHDVNKLELRWTEQGFCDARGDAGPHIVKEAGPVRWEQPIYEDRDAIPVIEGGGNHGNHHVVIASGGATRWDDPASSLCDANDEDETRNDGEPMDPKRTREVRWTEQALCDALAAVKSGTVTAYKASKDYGIPRSTLRNWLNGRNRSRKRGPRVDEALSFCRQELGGGGGNCDGSGGVTVVEGGAGGNSDGNGSDGGKEDDSWRKRKRAWTKQTLFEALHAVKTGEMAAAKAAEVFGIPNSTLDYWVKGATIAEKRNFVPGRDDGLGVGVGVGDGVGLEEDEDEDEEEEEEEDEEPTTDGKNEPVKKRARDEKPSKKKVGGWSEKALSEAMEAIKNNSLTICKASRAYGIPRTTLRNWITGRTRSRKRGPHTGLPFEQVGDEEFGFGEVRDDESDQLEVAVAASGSGSGVKRRGKGGKWSEQALLDAIEAVRNVGLPPAAAAPANEAEDKPEETESGLRYESTSDMKEAEVEVEVEEKSKKSNGWTEQALMNAIAAIKSGISIRKAGQSYGIPRTTLRNWLNGRTHSRKRGPHGGMSRGEQESAIVEWFFSMQQVCQSLMTLNALRRRAATLSVNKGSPFKDGIPVKKWWLWFNQRHADVAARVGDCLYETQNRNLLDEMSVVHMITGEHLQILKKNSDLVGVGVGIASRGEDVESSSQDDHDDQQHQQVQVQRFSGASGVGQNLSHLY